MFIERKNYNNTISIKLVIPTSCNAKCPFCYNNDKNMNCNKIEFLNNFINSLKDILDKIGNENPVSIDITGGEPTLDISLIKEVLHQLKINDIHSKVSRIVMTTNGINLLELINTCEDMNVIDYINISVHDYNATRRFEIFKTKALTDFEYRLMINKCNELNIKCSAVSVLFKNFEDDIEFKYWFEKFVYWAKNCGFIGIRFRYSCDDNLYCSEFNNYMQQIMDDSFYDIITFENTPDSCWCRLRRKNDGFRVFFLHGVKDTTLYTKGIEYIIDNDEKCYCDYYKKTPIEHYKYEIGKIYDNEDYMKGEYI